MGLNENVAKVHCRFFSAHVTSETLDSPSLFPAQCSVLTVIKYDEHCIYYYFLLDKLER